MGDATGARGAERPELALDADERPPTKRQWADVGRELESVRVELVLRIAPAPTGSTDVNAG